VSHVTMMDGLFVQEYYPIYLVHIRHCQMKSTDTSRHTVYRMVREKLRQIVESEVQIGSVE